MRSICKIIFSIRIESFVNRDKCFRIKFRSSINFMIKTVRFRNNIFDEGFQGRPRWDDVFKFNCQIHGWRGSLVRVVLSTSRVDGRDALRLTSQNNSMKEQINPLPFTSVKSVGSGVTHCMST